VPGQSRPPRKRSPGERAGLSRDAVLAAALDLVDRDGLRALSMRRLADALGVEAMTLYNHVPNKDALLDGLVEQVYAEATTPGLLPGEEWSAMLRRYALALRETLLRHPRVLPLTLSRPAATPVMFEAVEQALQALTNAGFTLGRALDVLNVVSIFVLGHTIAEVDVDGSSEQAGPGSIAAVAALDVADFPLLTQAARRGEGTDDAARFAFGLEALLAGLAVTPE